MSSYAPARQPAGLPTGGQFASQAHGEPEALAPPEPIPPKVEVPVDWAARRWELLDDRYVPAVAARLEDSDRSGWWSGRLALGEYGHADGDYPKMGERDSDTGLRANLARYAGTDRSVRMPSAASVKRFPAG